MRIPARVADTAVGFNMTPMIDVVFQLIIFFLLSSHLAKQETQLALPLPVAESGAPAAPGERPQLTINVLADGTLLVANRPLAAEALFKLLVERSAAHGTALEVRIRGDRRVPYDRVEPVLRACAQAGIWNVAYGVHARSPAAGALDPGAATDNPR
jgi:biopolymer transport protein ExbD